MTKKSAGNAPDRRLNGLDLFSGIGGITLALGEWINTVAYCEGDRHAQAVLMSRMREGLLPNRPIWDDVRTLRGSLLPPVDIIVGGFPCQDISVAGKGAGLGGERSGLFFEIVRLAKEIEPTFLFLENVPAIRTRGLDRVVEELTALGYDLRWTMLSAEEVGAPHKRERWFCLAAHANSINGGCESWRRGATDRQWNLSSEPRDDGAEKPLADAEGSGRSEEPSISRRGKKGDGAGAWRRSYGGSEACDLADANGERCEEFDTAASGKELGHDPRCAHSVWGSDWWATEPNVGRVADGVPFRVDRLKRLGNAVVPLQAREAFKELMGLRE